MAGIDWKNLDVQPVDKPRYDGAKEAQAPEILYKLAVTEDGRDFLPLYQQGVVMQPVGFAAVAVAVLALIWWQRGALGRLARPVLFLFWAAATLLLLGAASVWREVYVATQVWIFGSPGETGAYVALVYGLLTLAIGGAARVIWRARPLTPTDQMFAAAASELDSGAADKGVLARLSAKHGGNEQKARAAYIRERAWVLAALEKTKTENPPVTQD